VEVVDPYLPLLILILSTKNNITYGFVWH
jgi:hypothetical protein